MSIVTPVYNRENYIEKTIKSILNQTYENFEYIIVNDCSIDNTGKILKSYSKKDARIKILNNSKNRGPTYTAAKGYYSSKGKYIARLDSDDFSYPNRLEKQVKFLESNPKIGMVGSHAATNNKNPMKVPVSNKEIKYTALFTTPIINSCKMFRKDLLDFLDVNLSDKGSWEVVGDKTHYNFFVDINRVSKVANLDEKLVYCHRHKGSHSSIVNKSLENKVEFLKPIWIKAFNNIGININKKDLDIHSKLKLGGEKKEDLIDVDLWLKKLYSIKKDKTFYKIISNKFHKFHYKSSKAGINNIIYYFKNRKFYNYNNISKKFILKLIIKSLIKY